MNRTNSILGFAGLIVLVVASLAIRQVRVSREAATALAATQRANEALSARLRVLHQRVIALDQDAATLQKSVDGARAAKADDEQRGARVASAATARPAMPSTAEGESFMARHPEVKHAVLDVHRAQIAGQFGPFFKAHDFTPEQIATFTNAMMHGAGVVRMTPGADGKPFVLSVPGWGDPQKRREEEAQLVALLGEAGIRELREYVLLLPAQRLAAQLAGALHFTPTPLTTQQAELLTRAVASVRPAPGGPSSGQNNWPAIMPTARVLLSDPQLAALAGLQAQEEFNLAMSQATRRRPQSDVPVSPAAGPGR